jgi:hypothetical protein
MLYLGVDCNRVNVQRVGPVVWPGLESSEAPAEPSKASGVPAGASEDSSPGHTSI